MQQFDLSGRVAVITGASRGIGEALAWTYVRAGAKVVITSRKADNIEPVGEAMNAEFPGQVLCTSRRVQSNGQDHHIEFFLLYAIVGSRIPYGDILAFRVLFGYRCVASDKSNPSKSLCPFVEPLKILAMGTNVVMEYRTLCLCVMLFCQNDLFLGICATYG